MRATNLEWLETIKSPTGDHTTIRELAIRRVLESGFNRYGVMFTNNNHIISSSLHWSRTPEGFGFWRDINAFNNNN